MQEQPGQKNNRIVESFRSVLYIGSFILIAGWLYYEFIRDIRPLEAIEFYRMEPTVRAEDNIAFALDGIAAPAQVENFHAWGVRHWQYFRGMSRDEFEDRWNSDSADGSRSHPFDDRLDIEFAPFEKHNYCWQPGTWEADKRCISRQQMESLLQANAVMLRRYQQALSYPEADFVFGATLINQHVLEITKQYQISFWLRRDQLDSGDLQKIAEFLNRWKRIVDHGLLNSFDYSLAMVAYGNALRLFHETSKLYPRLLEIYQQGYGGFEVTTPDSTLFERLAIGNFHIVDRELCLSKTYRYADSYCTPNSATPIYKPGRTIELMYRSRTLPENCGSADEPRLDWPEHNETKHQLRLLLRPGNYRGRMHARGHRGYLVDKERICRSVASHRFRNEVFGMYSLYARFKAENFTPARIESEQADNRETFRVPFSNRYYRWDPETGSLILDHSFARESASYALPYE